MVSLLILLLGLPKQCLFCHMTRNEQIRQPIFSYLESSSNLSVEQQPFRLPDCCCSILLGFKSSRYQLLCLSKLLVHCPTSNQKFSKTIMQITSHTIEYLGKCSDEACLAYGTLTCTRGTLSKEMRKKKKKIKGFNLD